MAKTSSEQFTKARISPFETMGLNIPSEVYMAHVFPLEKESPIAFHILKDKEKVGKKWMRKNKPYEKRIAIATKRLYKSKSTN